MGVLSKKPIQNTTTTEGTIKPKPLKKPLKKLVKKVQHQPEETGTEKEIEQQVDKEILEQGSEQIQEAIEPKTDIETSEEVQQKSVEQVEEQTVEETSVKKEETDVNVESKNSFIDGENSETEEKSETKKTTKKSSKSKKKQKEEASTDKEQPIINYDDYITDFEEITDYLSDIFITSKEWVEEKEELNDKLETLHIAVDLEPDSMRIYLSNLSEFYSTIQKRLENAEDQYNSLTNFIDGIRTLNSKGSNASERKYNELLATKFYKKNPDDEKCVDLTAYETALENKINTYKKMINTMDFNQKLLITFSAAYKIETRTY